MNFNMESLLRNLVSSILFLSLTTSAFSQVNLLESKSGHFKNIPIYNQLKIGNCYSFASINIYDNLRSRKGVSLSSDKVTSSLWASVVFRQKTFMGSIAKKQG